VGEGDQRWAEVAQAFKAGGIRGALAIFTAEERAELLAALRAELEPRRG
jgi:hypothetical protein